jgi:exosortase E/protease (VPEID-CTERM system)
MLGTPNFMVMIDYRCSGYEGIGMITVFLTWYLMSFRNDFKFPAALLLFPIGITIIWLFNSIRISLLIFIGSSISPAIAMQGFHSNAGWVSFIMVSLGIIFFARNIKMFRGTVSTPHFTIDSVNALVIPFLVTLAVTLISSSFSTEFQWLYPVRVIFTGLAIFLLWKHFNIKVLAPPLFSILAGIFVFLLWIAMVSPSIEGDRKFGENLFNAPDYWSTGWIIMRLLGSVIIIPIAEELAFRGYLFSFFPSDRVNKGTTKEIQWVPMVLTSVLFGALHSFWVAGTIAGCVYYLVKLRSGHIWNAIVAHMTTNLLLSSYVLISGHWSYW